MPTQNLYDSITLAENIKLQAKARNVQLKDMFAEPGMTTSTAPWTSSWGALLTPP